MSDIASIHFDKELINNIIAKKMQVEIMKSLGNTEELIAKIVQHTLSTKVSRNGTVSNYESDNRYDFVELVCEKHIREAAKEALHEWLEDNKYLIIEAVQKELKSKNRQKTIAQAYLNAIEKSLSCSWDMNCNINFKEQNI